MLRSQELFLRDRFCRCLPEGSAEGPRCFPCLRRVPTCCLAPLGSQAPGAMLPWPGKQTPVLSLLISRLALLQVSALAFLTGCPKQIGSRRSCPGSTPEVAGIWSTEVPASFRQRRHNEKPMRFTRSCCKSPGSFFSSTEKTDGPGELSWNLRKPQRCPFCNSRRNVYGNDHTHMQTHPSRSGIRLSSGWHGQNGRPLNMLCQKQVSCSAIYRQTSGPLLH
uniref:Uncharacterized protein n=1 Tax=Sphaerodactylus townsendi TaxID=933632 RepID=A0ACB8EY39_9SAUR